MDVLKQNIKIQMSELITKKNYPCMAAVKSLFKNDYEIGIYKDFGSMNSSLQLATDLMNYAKNYEITKSPYFTFWAVFSDAQDMTDEDFEARLWKELSGLASRPEFPQEWDPQFSSNPEDKNFCFSLGGQAFFVVGLHKNSVRDSRKFQYPTLVFNLYEQFRQRDEKFQGYANPVVVENGNDWEAIQFSGRHNTNEWKCPFAKVFDFLKI